MSARRIVLTTLLTIALSSASQTTLADTDDDCIAASERAVTLRRAGSLLLSREQLSTCSALACASALRTSCEKRLAELNAQVPTMVFRATDSRGADTTAVKLFIDGKLNAASLTGQAIAVDPGSHTFRFETANADGTGVQTIEKQWVVNEGEKGRAELVSFAPPSTPASPDPHAGNPERAHDGRTGWSSRRKAGLIVGGVGAIGVGVGAVFGAMAISQWNDAKAKCTSANTCGTGSSAQHDHDAAATSAMVSTVSLIAGGALFAGGATLFFWPSSPDGAARGASFGIRGEF